VTQVPSIAILTLVPVVDVWRLLLIGRIHVVDDCALRALYPKRINALESILLHPLLEAMVVFSVGLQVAFVFMGSQVPPPLVWQQSHILLQRT
jgi:hypothetical protein